MFTRFKTTEGNTEAKNSFLGNKNKDWFERGTVLSATCGGYTCRVTIGVSDLDAFIFADKTATVFCEDINGNQVMTRKECLSNFRVETD